MDKFLRHCIKLLPCPLGFVPNEVIQMCQCDPVLTIISSCNIDDQTVLCPASSWIKQTHKICMLVKCP